MKRRSLLPERWRGRDTARTPERVVDNPFLAMQREMNRLFDGFFRDFSLSSWLGPERAMGMFSPRIDIVENDKEVAVSAELPGMDDKDVEVTVSNGVLTIQGEKKDEHKKETDRYSYFERTSGSFRREIRLPDSADIDKAKAVFKNGLLRVSFPRLPGADKERKRIAIKSD